MMDQMNFGELVMSPLWQLNLVGLAGIVVWRLIPSRRSNTRLVIQMAFFAAMTAILVGNNLMSFESEAPEALDANTLLVLSASPAERSRARSEVLDMVYRRKNLRLLISNTNFGDRTIGRFQRLSASIARFPR